MSRRGLRRNTVASMSFRLTAAAYFLIRLMGEPKPPSPRRALLGLEVRIAAVRLGRHGIIRKASTSIRLHAMARTKVSNLGIGGR
jgi:hypothetical protein